MDLCAAIANKKMISFTYDGHHRVVAPAAHGSQKTTGNHVLRGYQVGGTGKTRTVPFWDLFLVDKMSNVEVQDQGFVENPPYYSRGDKHIAPIHCEL
jgi:hypothetical protein